MKTSCTCGVCKRCKHRIRDAEYRARNLEKLRERNRNWMRMDAMAGRVLDSEKDYDFKPASIHSGVDAPNFIFALQDTLKFVGGSNGTR